MPICTYITTNTVPNFDFSISRNNKFVIPVFHCIFAKFYLRTATMKAEEKNIYDLNNQRDEIEDKISVVAEPSVAYGKQRYSYADYLTWTDDTMREIIDGFVYTFSAPFRRHAKATASIFGKAWSYINRKKGKCEIYTAPFDVRLPINGETADNKIYNVVQPDICVICDPSKLDERGCIGAPDLVVEVMSPSTNKKDIDLKFHLYEKAGVCEYWVVYPSDKAVTVFILQMNGKYDEGTAYDLILGPTKVPVQTLAGLVIDLEELFEE
jgi:Uma2 family endonuclease